MTHNRLAPVASSPRSVAHARVEIPVLFCPFDGAYSEHAHAVNEATLAWAATTGIVASERGASKLRASRIGWLAGRAFPGASLAGLQLAADWTALFCLLDDRCEALSPSALSPLLAGLLDAFRRGDAGVGADPFARAMATRSWSPGCSSGTCATPSPPRRASRPTRGSFSPWPTRRCRASWRAGEVAAGEVSVEAARRAVAALRSKAA